MLMTIARQNALQKWATWNPTTTLGTTRSNSAFRMRMKKPNVTRIRGTLRINRKGRTNALRIPSKREAPINAAIVS